MYEKDEFSPLHEIKTVLPPLTKKEKQKDNEHLKKIFSLKNYYEEKIKELTRELKNKDEKLNNLYEELSRINNKISSMQEENNILKKELEKLSLEKKNLLEEKETLLKDINNLQNTLNDLSNHNNFLQNFSETLKNTIENKNFEIKESIKKLIEQILIKIFEKDDILKLIDINKILNEIFIEKKLINYYASIRANKETINSIKDLLKALNINSIELSFTEDESLKLYEFIIESKDFYIERFYNELIDQAIDETV